MTLFEGIQLGTDMKLIGDEYCGGYSSGLTMHDSGTLAGFQIISSNERETIYQNDKGIDMILSKEEEEHTIRVRTIVKNGSMQPIKMEMLASFLLKGIKADKICRMLSFWSAEGRLKTDTIEDLMLEPSWNTHAVRVEKFGCVGSLPVRKYFPWLVLVNEEKNEYIGIQLYCASSWQMDILCRRDESLTVLGGLADRDFGHWQKTLNPGDTFISPDAVIATGHSLEEVCDYLVKAQKPDISKLDDHMGIAFNEYCTTWGNPSYDNLKKICDQIADKGIQYLTIDSGWYAQAENWWDRIGEWDANQKRFPGGMRPICDYIRSKGMIPGLWYEFEGVSSQCEYYHQEEHLLKKDGVPYTVGGKRFFDMEDPWVIDYLSEKVIGLLKESGFGYLKVDYNETLGIGIDDEDGFGEGLRKKVLATQEFFKKIKREIPDIVIENCASGGHRLEPSMMELVSQASFSDAHELVSMPIIAANLHRVIKPSQSQIWAVMRAKDDETRICYSMINTFLGRMCLSGDIYDLSMEQWNLILDGMDFYKQVSLVIDKGVTKCQICNPVSYNHPVGEQLVIREYENRGLLIFHRFENSKELDESFLKDKKVIRTYGKADRDFSAVAYYYEII